MSATVAENIKRTIHTTINALNAWDYDALVSARADGFKFQGLPRSLNMPEMDSQAFRDHWFNFMTPNLKNFKVIYALPKPLPLTDPIKLTVYR